MYKQFAAWVRIQWQNRFGLVADAKKVVRIMEQVRNCLKSKTAQLIVQAIPGTTDDRILAAITKALDKVLNLVDAINKNPVYLTNHSEAMQNALIHKVASQTVRELHPRITEVDADFLIQEIYARHKAAQS